MTALARLYVIWITNCEIVQGRDAIEGPNIPVSSSLSALRLLFRPATVTAAVSSPAYVLCPRRNLSESSTATWPGRCHGLEARVHEDAHDLPGDRDAVSTKGPGNGRHSDHGRPPLTLNSRSDRDSSNHEGSFRYHWDPGLRFFACFRKASLDLAVTR